MKDVACLTADNPVQAEGSTTGKITPPGKGNTCEGNIFKRKWKEESVA